MAAAVGAATVIVRMMIGAAAAPSAASARRRVAVRSRSFSPRGASAITAARPFSRAASSSAQKKRFSSCAKAATRRPGATPSPSSPRAKRAPSVRASCASCTSTMAPPRGPASASAKETAEARARQSSIRISCSAPSSRARGAAFRKLGRPPDAIAHFLSMRSRCALARASAALRASIFRLPKHPGPFRGVIRTKREHKSQREKERGNWRRALSYFLVSRRTLSRRKSSGLSPLSLSNCQ